MKFKIKDSLYLLKEKEDLYQVIFTGIRRIKKFQVDDLTKDLFDLLKTPLEEKEIYKKMNHSKENISLCLKTLENFGIVRKYEEKDLDERYKKQILFIDELTNSWDETISIHKRFRDSKIVVFGVGGIGTWMVNGLYQMGIGEIRITDPDFVSESNLNRQLFFTSKDVGKYKVDVVSEKIPDANIITFKKRVSENESLEEIVSGTNFIVNCADNPSVSRTTEIIDKYAQKYEIPYCVAGGYNMHLGMVGPIIIPGKTKTFEDFLKYQKENDPLKDFEVVKNISDPGNLGPIAGAVANMQLMEIFKHIAGKGTHNYDRFSEFDFMDFGFEWREF
jgi:molybdopterin-synthase adenylyltransferase